MLIVRDDDTYAATNHLPPGESATLEVTLEPGVTLLIHLEAISEADERGYRTVLATLNGQLRTVTVRDT